MKILVAQSVFKDRRGGMSRLMGFIHDEVEKAGHRVDYLGCEDITPWLRGKLSRFAFPWLVWRHAVAAKRRGEPYDIVTVHEPSGACITRGRKAAGSPKIVAMSYGLEERGWQIVKQDARLKRNPLPLKTRIWHPLTLLPQARYTLLNSDHIFCSNEEDKIFLKERYQIPESQITRVHSGASIEYIDAYQGRNYDNSSSIVFFGTWIVRKGVPDLIEAFGKLPENRNDIKLIVMGAGVPDNRVLESFPEKLRNRVVVVPPSSAETYGKILRNASLMVIPSVFEGTPLTMMESMAAGLPVVATNTCGMRDVIQHGENGLLVPVRDGNALASAIAFLLDSRERREMIGRNSNELVSQHYTWPTIGQKVLKVYEKMVNK